MNLSVPSASGTSVVLIAANALIGVFIHTLYFFLVKPSLFLEAAPILLFTIPGVLLGAQIGVRLSRHMAFSMMEAFLGIMFSSFAVMILFNILKTL